MEEKKESLLIKFFNNNISIKEFYSTLKNRKIINKVFLVNTVLSYLFVLFIVDYFQDINTISICISVFIINFITQFILEKAKSLVKIRKFYNQNNEKIKEIFKGFRELDKFSFKEEISREINNKVDFKIKPDFDDFDYIEDNFKHKNKVYKEKEILTVNNFEKLKKKGLEDRFNDVNLCEQSKRITERYITSLSSNHIYFKTQDYSAKDYHVNKIDIEKILLNKINKRIRFTSKNNIDNRNISNIKNFIDHIYNFKEANNLDIDIDFVYPILIKNGLKKEDFEIFKNESNNQNIFLKLEEYEKIIQVDKKSEFYIKRSKNSKKVGFKN